MSSFWEKIREDFPNVRRGLYLDHAAGGPIPAPVQARMQQTLDENAREADFAWPRWMKRAEHCRSLAAKFLNAEPEEIAFIHSTSQGMNAIAEMVAGQGAVLTNTSEFPSSTLPWIWRKARMVYQKPGSGGLLALDPMRALLAENPSVKTVVSSYVQYATGFRQDLAAVGRLKGNRYLAVNATQALGALPIDVKAWKADFVCANSYKWLMAGYGGGLLYVRRPLLKKFRPASMGWRSVVHPDAMNNRRTNLRGDAARYEMGVSSFGTIFAVGAAIEYMMQIGMDKIARRILELSAYVIERLSAGGFQILSPIEDSQRSGIVIAGVEQPGRIWKRLLAKGVFVSPRGGGLRIGPHFYNTHEEIDRFVKLLSKCRDEETRTRSRKGERL